LVVKSARKRSRKAVEESASPVHLSVSKRVSKSARTGNWFQFDVSSIAEKIVRRKGTPQDLQFKRDLYIIAQS
jgi:hypothetical protein